MHTVSAAGSRAKFQISISGHACALDSHQRDVRTAMWLGNFLQLGISILKSQNFSSQAWDFQQTSDKPLHCHTWMRSKRSVTSKPHACVAWKIGIAEKFTFRWSFVVQSLCMSSQTLQASFFFRWKRCNGTILIRNHGTHRNGKLGVNLSRKSSQKCIRLKTHPWFCCFHLQVLQSEILNPTPHVRMFWLGILYILNVSFSELEET